MIEGFQRLEDGQKRLEDGQKRLEKVVKGMKKVLAHQGSLQSSILETGARATLYSMRGVGELNTVQDLALECELPASRHDLEPAFAALAPVGACMLIKLRDSSLGCRVWMGKTSVVAPGLRLTVPHLCCSPLRCSSSRCTRSASSCSS